MLRVFKHAGRGLHAARLHGSAGHPSAPRDWALLIRIEVSIYPKTDHNSPTGPISKIRAKTCHFDKFL